MVCYLAMFVNHRSAGANFEQQSYKISTVSSNAVFFLSRDPNPTLFIYVMPEGKFIERRRRG